MKGQAGAVILSLAMLILNSPLCAARATARCKVLSIDFSKGTISLVKGNDCPSDEVRFTKDTKFEYGHDNAVDSSKLVVAKTIELKCPESGVAAKKITIRYSSDEHPPRLTQGLGDFPLDQIITRVGDCQGPDRFGDVEGDPDPKDGVQFMKLKPTFSTGNCRINPDPEQVQCDYVYSNTLSKILQMLVGKIAEQLKLEKQASDASTQTFIDRAHRVLVRFSNSPPASTITVEVY